MGLLAETVMSMSGAQVTTGEVAFQRSPVLTPLLLYFSTRGFEAPGSRQAPSIPYSPPLLFARRGLLAASKRPAQNPIVTCPLVLF